MSTTVDAHLAVVSRGARYAPELCVTNSISDGDPRSRIHRRTWPIPMVFALIPRDQQDEAADPEALVSFAFWVRCWTVTGSMICQRSRPQRMQYHVALLSIGLGCTMSCPANSEQMMHLCIFTFSRWNICRTIAQTTILSYECPLLP
jgi:hypothetical protein